MNILFITLALRELTQSSMYSDLANEFVKQGHSVYPVAPTLQGQKTQIYQENGINVLRIKTMPLFKVNVIRKGIANITLSFLYKRAIKKFWKEKSIDVIVVPTPSVLFSDVVASLKKHYNAKVYLILRDIFPQNAVDLGFINKHSIIYKYFRAKEQKFYLTADQIGCTSQGNIDFVIKHNAVSKEKLHILNNFSKKYEVVLDPTIKKRYKLENKFVIVFGGNIGIPQQFDNVLKFAIECQQFENVLLLIIGKRGTEIQKIKEITNKEIYKNVIFIDYLERDEYSNLLKVCDLGLISLNEKFTVPNTPYKLNDYFMAKLPVLASIDKGTDLGKILLDNNMGLYAYAGDVNALFEQFKILYQDENRRLTMGENGYKFFMDNMLVENACKTIVKRMQINNF